MSDHVIQQSRPHGRTEVPVLSLLTNPPVGWKAVPHYAVFRRVRRVGYEDLPLLSVYRDLGIVPREGRDDNHNRPSEDLSNYQRVNKGDLVINKMKAWQGSVGVSDYQGLVSPAYFVFEPVGRNHGRFLHHLLRSDVYTAAYGAISKGIRVDQWDLDPQEHSRLPVILPPIEEQRRIAAFLDHETTRIDELVREQERLVGLARQKRRASIRELTHFGLSHDVEFRSTGIEWLPQVPSHWRLSQIGFEARVGNGSTPARENESYWQDGDIPWMNSSKINEVFITGADQFVTQKALQECHLPLVPSGSVLIAITGEGRTRGLSAITCIDTTINQHLAYISVTRDRVLPEYMHYYLEGQYEHLRYESSGTGSTRAALTCAFIQKYPVPVPPLGEQQRIVDVLNRDLSQYASLVENAESMKRLLLERRSSLITAAVTGQLDVRDWDSKGDKVLGGVA